jgi:serine phosphatase RsbU (regulator of sigma subunit)
LLQRRVLQQSVGLREVSLTETETESFDKIRAELTGKQATVDALMQGFIAIEFPKIDGLAFDTLYQPAALIEQLGGDWYDVFSLPDGRVAFSLGDACGKGIGAAVKMGQAKQAIKVAACLDDPAPIAVLRRANKVIFLNDHHVEFTTAIYGIVDVAKRTVIYASAGHHPPILAKAGAPSTVLPNHGFALGVEVEMPDLIREHRFSYEAGSLLVLYTDGLIEFDRNAADGEAQLLVASRAAVEERVSSPASFIVESVVRKGLQLPDDVAVLTIRFA